MDENPLPQKKHNLVKWIISFFGLLIIILLASAWYFNQRWKPVLTSIIQNTVLTATDSLYKVSFSNIKINILSGGVTIDSIEVIPDLKVYQKLIRQKAAPENIINLKVAKLTLKNVNPIKVYRHKKLDIRSIIIENPALTVFYSKLKNQLAQAKDHRTVYERVKEVLKEVKIESLFLSDVNLKYVDQSFEIPKTTYLDKVNIRLNDILIDSTSATDQQRIFTAKDVIAEISDYNFATPDSMYQLNIKHLGVSTQNKQLVVEGIALIPRYKEIAFSNQFEYQKERYKIMFDSLIASNINFNDLLEKRTFAASSVKLMHGELDVFLNRDKPKPKIDKGKNFPHLALQRVAWGIITDTLILKNINISYKEFNPKTKGKGTVYFSDLDGRIFNVTNDSAALSKNNFANAHLSTFLMGRGKLNVHIAFNLTDPKGGFSYDGDLGEMQTSTINALTKPMAMVMTSSGKVNSMKFDMKGNVDGAGGSMTLNYEDLNVILMKKDEQENFKRMGLMSLFANALLLERNNPSGKNPIRVAKPYYARPPEGSFFNLMWKTIFAGLKESVGITKEKEAKLLQRAENFKDAREKREQRKNIRQKRKAVRKSNK
jgi:hypothetical protein